MGLGLTLVWGVLRVLNFAHPALLVWAGFSTLYFLDRGVPALVATVIGVGSASLLAVVLNVVVIQPLRRRSAPELAYVVATIGAGLVVETLLRWRVGAQFEPFPQQGFPTGSVEVLGVRVSQLQLTTLVVASLGLASMAAWLKFSRFGTATRLVADAPQSAPLLGINVSSVYIVSFAVSGALAGVAGVVLAVSAATISFSSGEIMLLPALAVMILGGLGSIWGAMAGGLVLGCAEVFAVSAISSDFKPAVSAIAILLVLLARPTGLFSRGAVDRA